MQYKNTKDTEKLLKIFYSDEYGFDEEKIKLNLKEVSKYYGTHTRHQYYIVSRFVNQKMKESGDAINGILDNIGTMLDLLENQPSECTQIIKEVSDLEIGDVILNLEKLYDHIALEEERLKNNTISIRHGNEEVVSKVVSEFNGVTYDFKRKVEDISSSLNANIITVVGLFSAIIFVFFGGVSGMSGVVEGISKLKCRKNIILPLICLIGIGFVMFNIVFLLLYSISKLVDKNIGMMIMLPYCNRYTVREVESEENERFEIWNERTLYEDNGKKHKKYKESKAYKKVKWKNIRAKIWWTIKVILQKAFLRFPYVVVVNTIFVVSIIYLYMQL